MNQGSNFATAIHEAVHAFEILKPRPTSLDRSLRRDVTRAVADAEGITRRVEAIVKSVTDSRALSKGTQDQLRQLNALAQHVGQKLRSLGATKELVDRATGQLNEVNELVWDMDRKLEKMAL